LIWVKARRSAISQGCATDRRNKNLTRFKAGTAKKGTAMTGSRRSIKTAAKGAVGAVVLLASAAFLGALPASADMKATPASVWQMPSGFADEVEIRIAELHIALRVTPDQEPLFRAYADTMRANAQAIHALFVERGQATDFSAPARLGWYARLTATHANAVNNLIAPFNALYQSLSDSQKQAADRHFEALQQRRFPRRTR
jgi:periplasmic protein CpxP/Spy